MKPLLKVKMNGWWRLWLVASVIWLPMAWVIATPQGEMSYDRHRPEFLSQLSDSEQASLSLMDTIALQNGGARLVTLDGDVSVPVASPNPVVPSNHRSQDYWDHRIGVKMPNEFMLVFSPEVSLDARQKTISSYKEIVADAANKQRFNQVVWTATVIGSVPLGLAILGLTIAWVRSGFRNN